MLTLKLALTLDGRMAAPDGSSRWITGDRARATVHARRAEVDAVMVGAGTVAADDPALTVRTVEGTRQPARVVVDSSGRTPASAEVFAPGADVLVATTDAAPHDRHTAWKGAGSEVVVLPATKGGVDLSALMEVLARREWLEVMCEGGAELASSLLRARVVDRLELYYGPVVVGRGGPEVADIGVSALTGAPLYRLVSSDVLGDDVRLVYDKETT